MSLRAMGRALGAFTWLVAAVLTAQGCASAQKNPRPELSRLEGKKVALSELDGEPTSRDTVEVALVNQLVKRGTFELVSKEDVEHARVAHDQDPTDWKGVARRAGADYALKANVLAFNAETHKGYSEVEEDDSQLEAETGDGHTKRLYKVKSLTGHVKVELEFACVTNDQPDCKNDDHTGVAEGSDTVTADAKDSAIHLPPVLGFLEKIANQAFHRFFEEYH